MASGDSGSTTIPFARKGEILKAVLEAVREAGGRARLRDLFPVVEARLRLTEHERAILEKSGYIRWHTVVHFYSIDCVKAGYLQKEAGYWMLTETGAAAIKQPAEAFLASAVAGYRAWKAGRDATAVEPAPSRAEESEESIRQAAYDVAVEQAQVEIEAHIRSMGPYDFQNVIAELMRAMGYFVPFVAPPGRDGGIDLLAYKDPLGTAPPRVKVQAKRWTDTKAGPKEVRELQGLLREDGDVGLLVCASGFTSEAEREARSAAKHIELMDLARLVGMWKQHYERVSETGKTLLPLVPVYFLKPAQEA